MRRGSVAFGALTLVGLGLTGCGLMRYEQREPWRSQAEEACLSAGQVQPSASMSRGSKIEGPGACGIDYPFKVAALAGGSVGLKKPVTLACPIIPRIETWLEDVVKPAGALYFGVPVTDLRAGTYSCRPRNNQRGAKLSEHSFGNAMDVMAFVLADGREVSVVKGWRGSPAEQDFLREVFVGACRYFTTVLGPGADAFHYDHFHIDLARHDPRGERGICKPLLKFAPRLDGTQQRLPAPRPAAPGEVPPVDQEQEGPFDENEYSGRQPAAPPTAHALAAQQTYRPPAQAQVQPRAQVQAYPASPARPPMAALPPEPVGGFSADLPPRRPARPAVVAAAPPAPAGGYASEVPPRPPSGLPPAQVPEAPRGPLYSRPPVPGQSPQWLNGHGLY